MSCSENEASRIRSGSAHRNIEPNADTGGPA